MKKKLLYNSLKDDITIVIGDSEKIINKLTITFKKSDYEFFSICALDLYNKKNTLTYSNKNKIFYIKNSEKLKKEELYDLFDTMIFYKKKTFVELKSVELISIEKINFSCMSVFSFN